MIKSIRIFLATLVLFLVVGIVSVNYASSLCLLAGFSFTLMAKLFSSNTKVRRKSVEIQRFLRKTIFSQVTFAALVILLAPTAQDFYKNTVKHLDLAWFHSQLRRLSLNPDALIIQKTIDSLEFCSQIIGNYAFIILICWIVTWVLKRCFFIKPFQRKKLQFIELLVSLRLFLLGSSLLLGVISISARILTVLFSQSVNYSIVEDNATLKGYKLSIIPLDTNMEKFRVESEVKILPVPREKSHTKSASPEVLRFEPASTIVNSKSKGMLLRELEVLIPQQLEFDNPDKDQSIQRGKFSQSNSKRVFEKSVGS